MSRARRSAGIGSRGRGGGAQCDFEKLRNTRVSTPVTLTVTCPRIRRGKLYPRFPRFRVFRSLSLGIPTLPLSQLLVGVIRAFLDLYNVEKQNVFIFFKIIFRHTMYEICKSSEEQFFFYFNRIIINNCLPQNDFLDKPHCAGNGSIDRHSRAGIRTPE